MREGSPNLLARSKTFSLNVVRLYSGLPYHAVAHILGKQLLRSATSVGAHVREGKHSRSDAEMLSKASVALQEMEESRYWMELLMESGTVAPSRMEPLLREADELTAILYAGVRTLKRRVA
jgi:four helix bundle protein